MGKLIQGVNDFATVYPDLVMQWHPTKNGDLKPTDVTSKSSRIVWWYLPYDDPVTGKHFDFEWQCKVAERTKHNCPFLLNTKVWKGFNDLATTNPELAKEWHPMKNGGLTPENVTHSYTKKVWWLFPYDVPDDYPIEYLRGKHFDFEWQATVASRYHAKHGCPYLTAGVLWTGFNDLVTLYPELAKEWHPTKNGNLRPENVVAGSGRKVWWYLPYDDPITGKHFDFEWEAKIAPRCNGVGCPFLAHKAVWPGFNDLETVCPEIVKEWHPTKNGDLRPNAIGYGSGQKVWWYLPYDDPITGKHFDFEWKSSVHSRVDGKKCPYLSGKKVWKGFNDLESRYPELAKEWHPTKNGNLKPSDVAFRSGIKVWWRILYVDELTGDSRWLEWQCKVSDRIINGRVRGCPYLYPQNRLLRGFNDLETTHPDLAKEWHPTKNGNLTPRDITAYSKKRVWWRTRIKDEDTGEQIDYEWQTQVNNRRLGRGFPLFVDSFGERCVHRYLTSNGIEFACEETFDGLLGVGNGKLPYDFQIKNHRILIEYQGRQHYMAIDVFGGEDELKIRKEHDARKRKYAKEHDYTLIEISYKYDTYDKVAEYLDKHLLPLLENNAVITNVA